MKWRSGQIGDVRMPVKVVIFAVACSLLIAAAAPAPLPYYLAINYATKQCGQYWGGDEHGTYKLPPGWSTYEYQYTASGWFVETPGGRCSVPQPAVRRFAEICCSQLGYTYISEYIGTYHPLTDYVQTMEADQAQQYAQERLDRIQAIIAYAIIFFAIALVVTIIVQWRYEKRKQ
jgi:hypothetical protein